METLTAIAVPFVIGALVVICAPQLWIAGVVFLTFATLPTFIPSQIGFAGLDVFLHELPLVLGALYVLIYRTPNRNNDWCAAIVLAITAAGAVRGLWAGHDIAAIANDLRGLFSLALCVFIVGRIASTAEAGIALRAVKVTLWVSFAFILLGALGILELGGRNEDASLTGAGLNETANVTRILGPTTHLASATLAVTIALWAISPETTRRTIGYFVPALGITVLGFSRNGLVMIAVALLLAPIFQLGAQAPGGRMRSSGLIRAGAIFFVGIGGFLFLGGLLYLAADISSVNFLRSVHSAYLNRVLAGLTTSVRQVDYSTIYRLEEVRLLKLSITGNEFFGNGFGYRYRLQGARGAFGSHTYYAHHFYWWAVAKVGWLGLIGYMIPFLAGVVNAIFGPGRFALRTAAGAAAVGCMTIMTVAPLPEDAFGAPAFGALLGIALLHAPYPNEGFSSTPSSLAQNAKAPLGQRA